MKNLSRRGFIEGAALGTVGLGVSLQAAAQSGEISNEDALAAAERVMDLSFADGERAMIAEGLDDQLTLIQAVRSARHPNSNAPAVVFNPQLKDHTYRAQQDAITLYAADIPAIPDNAEDIAFAPLTHLSHWVRTRQIRSADLTELYLNRINRYAGGLECFVTLTDDLARAQAAQADKDIAAVNYRGPLHGIPYGLKDLFDTDGILTTWGAATHQDRVAEGDAHIVDLLQDAGAVLLGKTTCGALAQGDVWFGGVTRNPWNRAEGSSGSSAGSASATAAGLMGFAIGTETLGSIISPANRCGIVGLRPTFGRVGRTGGMALSWSLDKIGPITRYAEDAALVLAAINGDDMHDASARPWGFDYDGQTDLSGLTLGYDPSAFEGDDASAVDLAALQAAKSLGCTLREINLPNRDTAPLRLQIRAEGAAAFQEMMLDNTDDLLSRQTTWARPNSIRRMHFVSAVDVQQVDRLRRKLMYDMADIFDQCDAIIGPNYAGDMLWITNYTGHPQLTIRAGFEEREIDPAWRGNAPPDPARVTPKDVLPRNISLFGPLYEEGRLIAIARALETVLGVADRRPQL